MNAEKPELPRLVIEMLRDKPSNTWRYHSIDPDDTRAWCIYPFSTPYAYENDDEFSFDEPCYKETGVDVVWEPKKVEDYRQTLKNQGYRSMKFDDSLPFNLRHYIIHSQCPIEWHTRMDDGDRELEDRVTVWVDGDLPQ